MRVVRSGKFLGLIGGAALVVALAGVAHANVLPRINGVFFLFDGRVGEDNQAQLIFLNERSDIQGEVEVDGDLASLDFDYTMTEPNFTQSDARAGHMAQFMNVQIFVDFSGVGIINPVGETNGNGNGNGVPGFTASGQIERCNLYGKVFPPPFLNGDNGTSETGGETAGFKGIDGAGSVQLVCSQALAELGAGPDQIEGIRTLLELEDRSDIVVDALGGVFVTLRDSIFEQIPD